MFLPAPWRSPGRNRSTRKGEVESGTIEQTLPGLETASVPDVAMATGHAIPLTPQKRLMVFAGCDRPANTMSRFCGVRGIAWPVAIATSGTLAVSSPGSVCSIVPLSTSPFLVDLFRPGDRQGAGRNIVGYHGAGRNPCVVADRDGGDERIVDTRPDVAPDRRPLLDARVLLVRGDVPGCDVRVGSDVGVSEVRQMWHLRPLADARVLDLDEGSRRRTCFEQRTGPEVAERPDERALPDRRVDDDRVRPDLGARRDACGATDHGERVDDGVGLEHCIGVDPCASGIDDRDSREHVRLVDPVAECGCRRSELDSRVHTFRLHRASSLVHRDTLTVCHENADRVGQVELALSVVRREPVEHRPQPICPEHVDGRVDLANRALLVGRVAMLDDRCEGPVRTSQDAAVLLYVVRLEREDGRHDVCAAVRLDELAKERSRQQRRISRKYEDVVGAPFERSLRAANGVARAARLGLHGDRPAVERGRRRRRGHDDEWIDSELFRGGEHPVDHPPPEQRMEVLRDLGPHSRAEAGRHDDGSERPLSIPRHEGWGARIRTWDHGTKTRCLTAWLRPRASGHLATQGGSSAPTGRSTKVVPREPRADAARVASATWSKRPYTVGPAPETSARKAPAADSSSAIGDEARSFAGSPARSRAARTALSERRSASARTANPRASARASNCS